MLNPDLIIALFVFPAVLVLLSTVLNRISSSREKYDHKGYRSIELAVRCILGLPGMFILLFFTYFSFEYGVSVAWCAVGYIAGMFITFMIFTKREWNVDLVKLRYNTIDENKIVSWWVIFFTLMAVLFFLIISQLLFIQIPLERFDGFLHNFAIYIFLAQLVVVVLIEGNRRRENYFLYLSLIVVAIVFVLFPLFAMFKVGGLNWIIDSISRTDRSLLNITTPSIWLVSGGLLLGLMVFGQPQFIRTVSMAKDRNSIVNGGVISICVSVILVWACIYAGLIARAVMPFADIISRQHDSYSYLAPYYILGDHLGLKHAGILILGGILFLSTSCVLILTRVLKSNQSVFRISDQKLLRAIYLLLIVAGWIFFAGYLNLTVENLSVFWVIAGCALGPAFLVNEMDLKRPIPFILSSISALLVVSIWHYMRVGGIRLYGYPMVHEIIPGFLTGLIVLLIARSIMKYPREN